MGRVVTVLWIFQAILVLGAVRAQECDSEGTCDSHERCPVWKQEGECYRNRQYMHEYCPVSCSDMNEKKMEGCMDVHPNCSVWKSLGECEDNKRAMNKYCPKSCGRCLTSIEEPEEPDDPTCVDRHENCGFWAKHGECEANPNYMLKECQRSCKACKQKSGAAAEASIAGRKLESNDIVEWSKAVGVKQSAIGSERAATIRRLHETKTYWEKESTQHLPASVLSKCKNNHELCTFWANSGECENNAAYMTTNCAPACHTCELVDFSSRCPPLENQRPALHPGGLNKMFERIVDVAPGNRTLSDEEIQNLAKEKIPQYTVTVHSRPTTSPATEVSPVLDKSLPPWVVTFDNFMTDEECEEMIQIGYKYEYQRSEDVGAQNFDGSFLGKQSKGRTSENAWCSSLRGCRKLELPSRIHERIAQVLGIPAENSEDFQILKYEVGQFYNTHHDYIPHQAERQCGPRILTFFMYLSDVEQGGGTNFPQLDLTIFPKKGRALLWPSVFDSGPMKVDSRTTHQALPVEEGTKFAFNGWIHMYDYLAAQSKGCN